MHIISASNSRLKLIARLRSKRGRAAEGRFVIDYGRDLQRALACGYQLDFLLRCPELAGEAFAIDGETHTISARLLKRFSYRENPDGLLAVMRSQPRQGLAAMAGADIRSALVLVDLRVPGNIGALMRSADASGCDAIMLVDCALDLYNPNIIRSSTGACFLDNIYQFGTDEAQGWLQSAGMAIVAADLRGDSLYLADLADSCAIVLGAEDAGLSADWLDSAHQRLRIPMAGKVADSLNVSVSGAIFMFEMQRQRSGQARQP